MNIEQLLGVAKQSLEDLFGVPKPADKLANLFGVTANSTPAGFITPKTAPSMNFPTSSAQLQPSTKIAQQEASKGFYNNPLEKVLGNKMDVEAEEYQKTLDHGYSPKMAALQAQSAVLADSAMGFTGSIGKAVGKKLTSQKFHSLREERQTLTKTMENLTRRKGSKVAIKGLKKEIDNITRLMHQ